jgi:cystathionine beta-lyase/cystathionine gamma-synthase
VVESKVVLSDDGTSEGNQMVSTLEATIKAVKEFNAEIIVGIDNTFLSPYILVC